MKFIWIFLFVIYVITLAMGAVKPEKGLNLAITTKAPAKIKADLTTTKATPMTTKTVKIIPTKSLLTTTAKLTSTVASTTKTATKTTTKSQG
ncbi:hypothetical protein PVAND_006452 [Polypedilum vanderplanki]|uniref:Uncharacterized protein n=1 Tax=Polypedilum vanderplanki TaxID=319348 RepID=A0A9J6C442_POLVA|nr:hypothetical protein PVAND_006452 [Polypedilum vanderplanki]